MWFVPKRKNVFRVKIIFVIIFIIIIIIYLLYFWGVWGGFYLGYMCVVVSISHLWGPILRVLRTRHGHIVYVHYVYLFIFNCELLYFNITITYVTAVSHTPILSQSLKGLLQIRFDCHEAEIRENIVELCMLLTCMSNDGHSFT